MEEIRLVLGMGSYAPRVCYALSPFQESILWTQIVYLPAVRVAKVPVKTMSDLRAGSNGGPDRRMYKSAIPCPRTG